MAPFRESNEEINEFMDDRNITGDYAALEAYFVKRVLDIVKGFNRTSVIWEDLIENGVGVYRDTIIQVWKPNYAAMLNKVRHTLHFITTKTSILPFLR